MHVWLDDDKEQHEEDSSPAAPVKGTGTLRFVYRVSQAEQRNSGKGAVDAESLQHHCSVALMVPGGEAKGQCVLPVVLDSGPGISIIGEAGLQHISLTLTQVVFPYERAPSVNIADGRGVSLTQQTCMLKVSVLTPWGQMGIRWPCCRAGMMSFSSAQIC